MSDSKKITLKSSDGVIFETEETVALQSQLITHMVQDGRADEVITLDNITGSTLTKVIEYCKKHVDVGSSIEELQIWDKEFMKNIDQSTIFELATASTFLDIKSLKDLSCRTIADSIANKTPEEVRIIFNLENDYTPEEEAKIREENSWVFDEQ